MSINKLSDDLEDFVVHDKQSNHYDDEPYEWIPDRVKEWVQHKEDTFVVQITNFFKISDLDTNKNSLPLCEITVCHELTKWKICRSYDDFYKVHILFTEKSGLPLHLPTIEECSPEYLCDYLRKLLHQYDSKLYNCPILMKFLDDKYGDSPVSQSLLEDVTKKIIQMENKIQNLVLKQTTLESLFVKLNQRLLLFENHQHSEKSENLYPYSVEINREKAALNSASDDHSKDKKNLLQITEENKDNDSSKHLVVQSESQIIYSYDKCQVLPLSSIPISDERHEYDGITEEIIDLVIPHEEQVQYRRNAVTTLIQFIKRIVGLKSFDVSFNALKTFLPDDRIRISILLTKGLSTSSLGLLHEKICRLSEGAYDHFDSTHLYHNAALSSNEEVQDDEMSDLGLNEYEFSNHRPTGSITDYEITEVVNNLTNEERSLTFNVTGLPVEISVEPKVDLCMLCFFEEFASLIGKDFLFKRSLLLVRAWWIYETPAYIGCPMRYYLSDYSLGIMLCSVFNQYSTKISTPLQALSIFLAEYGEVDWPSCAVTIQGMVPIRQSSGESRPLLRSPQTHHVVTEEMILKYCEATLNTNPVNSQTGQISTNVFVSNMNSPTTLASVGGGVEESTSGKYIGSQISQSRTATNYQNNIHPLSLQNPSMMSINSSVDQTIGPGTVASSTRSDTTAENDQQFVRRQINIVNPFTLMNMIPSSLGDRRSKRVVKVFMMGARNLNSVLKSTSQDTPPSHDLPQSQNTTSFIVHPMVNFFRNTYNRFISGWRPDVTNQQLTVTKSDYKIWSDSTSFSSGQRDRASRIRQNSELLWNQLQYCSFVQDGVLNDLGMLILCKEILREKGTLPVGEIGKTLQDLTSIPNLSLKLKEKYGGLKKYLEKYLDDFVVSTDHPFNPHVFLRRLVSDEDLEIISRGLVPPHITAKFKKASIAMKKKAQVTTVVPAEMLTNTQGIVHNMPNASSERFSPQYNNFQSTINNQNFISSSSSSSRSVNSLAVPPMGYESPQVSVRRSWSGQIQQPQQQLQSSPHANLYTYQNMNRSTGSSFSTSGVPGTATNRTVYNNTGSKSYVTSPKVYTSSSVSGLQYMNNEAQSGDSLSTFPRPFYSTNNNSISTGNNLDNLNRNNEFYSGTKIPSSNSTNNFKFRDALEGISSGLGLNLDSGSISQSNRNRTFRHNLDSTSSSVAVNPYSYGIDGFVERTSYSLDDSNSVRHPSVDERSINSSTGFFTNSRVSGEDIHSNFNIGFGTKSYDTNDDPNFDAHKDKRGSRDMDYDFPSVGKFSEFVPRTQPAQQHPNLHQTFNRSNPASSYSNDPRINPSDKKPLEEWYHSVS